MAKWFRHIGAVDALRHPDRRKIRPRKGVSAPHLLLSASTDQAPADMIVDAAYEAYADAGIDKPQRRIQAVLSGAQYPSRGTAEEADALKLYHRPATTVASHRARRTSAS